MTAEQPSHRRLLILLIAGGLALLLLVGIGVYGLLRGPGSEPADPTQPTASSTSAAPAPSAPATTGPEAIPAISDPETFARQAASALFTWDTTGGHKPADYAQVLSDVASDAEADALASDVRSYLPSTEAWAQLRQYQTRQWLTIEEVAVPQAWTTGQAQAAPGQLPDGASAYTITGTRHRAGIWGTEPVETSRPVTFTVFLACTAPDPEAADDLCRLIRLSELDNPLR